MKFSIKPAFVGTLSLLYSASSPVAAALSDIGGGMIFDDVANVTWLANVNLASILYSESGGLEGLEYGLMTWDQANDWAESLVYGGFDDWRLPSGNPNPGAYIDGYDRGEFTYFGHMLRNNLGNSTYKISGCETGCVRNNEYVDGTSGLVKKILNLEVVGEGPFYDPIFDSFTGDPVQGRWLWTSSESVDDSSQGVIFNSHWMGETKVDKSDLGYAWAIRGDGVGSMVPIPAAAWLFGSGLLGLLAVKRRR